MNATTSPMQKTAMLAMLTELPEMLLLIPGKPKTTASIITSTMTPAINRMNAGITGVNAPHVLFEPLCELVLVIFSLTLKPAYPIQYDIALLKPNPPTTSNKRQ